jgi:general secretion pathway protein A
MPSMDYFKILNLKQEPFSNSPGPEFFFESTVHLACLQQLEIAIRLHRGMNVVMGDVGTGKTTLCRHLILRFTESEDDRREILTHLLLDPSFSTPREFLAAVAASFGLTGVESTGSEWELKEGIKNYLFRRGVDEKKTVVLIIDEGQKLPEFCREILREFLNYDTNDNKLLQIVIFAQNEFREILKEHENFADRVNQCYLLGPLNFRETQEMIRFRLARAGRSADGPRLFTLPALWAIYRATGGYPRRIITLCHHILLAVIIRNRARAGWFLVRSAAKRLTPNPGRPKRWTATTTALAAALFLAFIALWYAPTPQNIARHPWPTVQTAQLTTPAEKPEPLVPPASMATTVKPAPPIQTTATAEPSVKPDPGQTAIPPAPSTKATPAPSRPETALPGNADPKKQIPSRLGQLKLREGVSLPLLLREIYGNNGTANLQAVALANPHISDMNRVRAGETISLPAIPASPGSLAPEKIWVQMAKKAALEDAYRLFTDYPSDMPPIRLIASWNPREGLVFTIVLKNGFSSAKAARDAIQHLPTGAKIMEKTEKGTIFFAN